MCIGFWKYRRLDVWVLTESSVLALLPGECRNSARIMSSYEISSRSTKRRQQQRYAVTHHRKSTAVVETNTLYLETAD